MTRDPQLLLRAIVVIASPSLPDAIINQSLTLRAFIVAGIARGRRRKNRLDAKDVDVSPALRVTASDDHASEPVARGIGADRKPGTAARENQSQRPDRRRRQTPEERSRLAGAARNCKSA